MKIRFAFWRRGECLEKTLRISSNGNDRISNLMGNLFHHHAKTCPTLHLHSFSLALLQSLDFLERKGNKNLSSFLESGRVEMSENLCPVLLSQKGLPFKTILVKREVDNVGEEIGEIFFQKKDPNPLAFYLFPRIP